jgi:hypothetical protein
VSASKPPVWGGDSAPFWKVHLNTGSGFASTAAHWAVPSMGTANGLSSVSANVWSTFDMNGDEKPDLVYTSDVNGDSSNPTVWGGDSAAHWKVYTNTGSGFATAAVNWTVPSLGAPTGYWLTGTSFWSTFDIDGDGRSDLVTTGDHSKSASMPPVWGGDGAAYWKVYLNTGSGFASTAAQWGVPSIGTALGLSSVSKTLWSTFDLNGDGRPDLVYTSDANGDSSNPTVWGGDSAAHWKVYAGSP